MSDHTEIAWTDATWNPVRGCTKVSAGCKHCYAERFAERFRGVKGHPFEQGFDVRLVPEALDLPLRWKKPRRVFVNSMSDLFHEDVPDRFILRAFDVMREAQHHTFQVLTKRPARMVDFCQRLRFDAGSAFEPGRERRGGLWLVGGDETGEVVRDVGLDREIRGYGFSMVMRNVWLGVSVEDQAAADERIPHLLATPAAVRFVSCEPLLGPVDLTGIGSFLGERLSALEESVGHVERPRLGWVIIGGESGPGASPCDLAWIRSLVAQCRAARTPAFVKQLGANVEDRNDAGFDGDTVCSWPMGTDVEHHQEDTGYQGAPVRVRLVDRKGGDPAEWPADLRVRQWPEASP